ncbi:unnamed protein product [Soboliphyme baturini]|uniref:PX domain-containing protein n=1 Tax=Soboliphyme baturini TaxID=241478 RepID=A0A183IIA2_9BILA|nr:unnamed protein product [Soboliphyme baturini]
MSTKAVSDLRKSSVVKDESNEAESEPPVELVELPVPTKRQSKFSKHRPADNVSIRSFPLSSSRVVSRKEPREEGDDLSKKIRDSSVSERRQKFRLNRKLNPMAKRQFSKDSPKQEEETVGMEKSEEEETILIDRNTSGPTFSSSAVLLSTFDQLKKEQDVYFCPSAQKRPVPPNVSTVESGSDYGYEVALGKKNLGTIRERLIAQDKNPVFGAAEIQRNRFKYRLTIEIYKLMFMHHPLFSKEDILARRLMLFYSEYLQTKQQSLTNGYKQKVTT